MVLRRDYRPVTEEGYDAVAELHAQGLGRNEIARQINRAQRTVSLIAQELGLEFDVTMTEVATAHRVAQLAAKRSIQRFTVTRSINGIVKAHSAGTAVSLVYPMRGAL
ncbi:hypothetical protein [Streptomyces sp. NBC_01481]|uniref:hypothetical protein n=1 Tax=Streptomyces sp. NBC_01481 TaxID=2975869 RepID=UPI0022508695|nr:hypothetical protein [Streptomyces sp. NBC_01481]MCX4581987.1 hypothetical protein [Streptomyces sp. NBC_01481]